MTSLNITSKDGIILGAAKSGAGPPLLLVHGATADHHRWETLTSILDKRFTIYAMDRRGRGESGDSPDYHLLREAEDVAAVIESIGEAVFVLGHSFGALCCLEASLLTDQIERMILYKPPLPGHPPVPADIPPRLQTFVDRGKLESALEMFFREVVRMPEKEFIVYRQLPMWKTRVALAPTIARELAAVQAYEFHPHRFEKLKTPVVLLLGGDSPKSVHQATQWIAEALPESRVVVLPDQQHIAMDTNPELFVSEVLSFLVSS